MTSLPILNETTKNLLKALADYIPPTTRPTEWKLVYEKNTGKVLDVTAGDVPLDANWIRITAQEASQQLQWDPRVRILNGSVVRITLPSDIDHTTANPMKLVQDPDGRYIADKNNMLLLTSEHTELTRRWTIGRTN